MKQVLYGQLTRHSPARVWLCETTDLYLWFCYRLLGHSGGVVGGGVVGGGVVGGGVVGGPVGI